MSVERSHLTVIVLLKNHYGLNINENGRPQCAKSGYFPALDKQISNNAAIHRGKYTLRTGGGGEGGVSTNG